jgi:hypothetical protein
MTYITNNLPSSSHIKYMHHKAPSSDPSSSRSIAVLQYMQPNPSDASRARVRPTYTYMYPLLTHPTAYLFTEPSKASYLHHCMSLRYTNEEIQHVANSYWPGTSYAVID